jgi:hypothetical protein
METSLSFPGPAKKHRSPVIGVRSHSSLPAISEIVRSKSLSVSRFSSSVTIGDAENSLKE